MKIEIKCRFTAKVLYEGEHEDFRAGLESAAKDGADLSRANLSGADLSGADLSRADLSRADLSRADLSRANLSGADLYGANLYRADLSRADLSGANLSGADLSRANLSGADLSRANLSGADLSGADLSSITGRICDSHELLARIAVRFAVTLKPVAAMIAGRLVGCWEEYTEAIRTVFGDATMQQLWRAWSQDESWGVIERMREHDWPEPAEATPSHSPTACRGAITAPSGMVSDPRTA